MGELVGVLLLALGSVGLGVALIAAFRHARRLPTRIFEEVSRLAVEPCRMVPVTIQFHTYCGFLAVVQQTTWKATLPLGHALVLLRRLHRYNCAWGFFAYGGAFVPIFSYLEYRRELARVCKTGDSRSGELTAANGAPE